MNAATKNIAIATIVAGSILLTGCAVTPTEPGTKPPAAVETTAPEPGTGTEPDGTPDDKPAGTKPTVETVAEIETGAVLSDAEAKAIHGKWQSGLKAYELPTGEKVLVKRNDPLPEPVQKAEEQKLTTFEMPTGSSNDAQNQTIAQLESAKSQAAVNTGKTVCAILLAEYGNAANGPGTSQQWVAIGCPFPKGGQVPAGANKASVIAEAEARIAAQPDPSVWALIVEP